jgi:hypothetical protein
LVWKVNVLPGAAGDAFGHLPTRQKVEGAIISALKHLQFYNTIAGTNWLCSAKIR